MVRSVDEQSMSPFLASVSWSSGNMWRQRGKVNSSGSDEEVPKPEEPRSDDSKGHEGGTRWRLHRLVSLFLKRKPRRLGRILLTYCCFVVMVLWKMYSFHDIAIANRKRPTPSSIPEMSAHHVAHNNTHYHNSNSNGTMRILHIVTSLSEYDHNDHRDRLMQITVPVLVNTVTSMVTVDGWTVDVYLILGYKLTAERRKVIAQRLPEGVGLEIWEDATPLGYDRDRDLSRIQEITRALARQHRFVIADFLSEYHVFSAWEDDMAVTASHVSHYLTLSRHIDSLRENPPPPWSRAQLERIFPGFFRVEVLTDASRFREEGESLWWWWWWCRRGWQRWWTSASNQRPRIDPSICCRQENNHYDSNTPSSDHVVAWEVAAVGFSVLELPPPIGWVALMPGPRDVMVPREARIHGYRLGDQDQRPNANDPRLFGQQGGFLATSEQIRFFQTHCVGSFLPPFSDMKDDGLAFNNVEFWSGGQQLWGSALRKKACALQRIVLLDDDEWESADGVARGFSRHLLYHTSNNKQHSINPRSRILRVDTLLAQLRAVVAAAKKETEGNTEQTN